MFTCVASRRIYLSQLQENRDLKSLMKQYLDGVNVTPTVLDKANPLFIVNGRVNALGGGDDSQVRWWSSLRCA